MCLGKLVSGEIMGEAVAILSFGDISWKAFPVLEQHWEAQCWLGLSNNLTKECWKALYGQEQHLLDLIQKYLIISKSNINYQMLKLKKKKSLKKA